MILQLTKENGLWGSEIFHPNDMVHPLGSLIVENGVDSVHFSTLQDLGVCNFIITGYT